MKIIPRKKIIIGIHGLGNKPPKDTLEEWWKISILEGSRNFGSSLPDVNFEMVYWADILHPEPLDVNITDKENILHIDNPYRPAENNSIKPYSKTRRKMLDYLEKVTDDLFLNEDFSINFSKITDKILHKYFYDLDLYYKNIILEMNGIENNIRRQIRDRLTKTLHKHRNKSILLISHSMGTIVAYDVLSKHLNDFKIDTFVTMGSPLGIPVIMNKIAVELSELTGTVSPPKAPDNIIRNWFNLSDLEDRIASNYNLNDDYQPNVHGVNAFDYIVYNNYRYKDNTNPHSSYGYLRTPEMTKIIEEFLEFDTTKLSKWWYGQIDQLNKVFKKILPNKVNRL